VARWAIPLHIGKRPPLRLLLPRPHRSGRRRWLASTALTLLTLALTPLARAQTKAQPEGVVDRVARTGELVLVGPSDLAPLVSVDAQGQPIGYGVEVARRIQAELASAVGRPVKLRFEAVTNPGDLGQRLAEGKADLACGLPFSWERDMWIDYSLPIGISGLRLLAPAGRLDGSPESLAGRRIGVVSESLAATELQGIQPEAKAVDFPSLAAAVAALKAGQVDGVIGDTALLASLAGGPASPPLVLTPEVPYENYALACVLPENDSAFRNLVNLAIARFLQGYLDGQNDAVTAVHRWVGPGSALNRSPEQIRTYYESVLLGVEAIRPLPPAKSSAQPTP
jgi:polar amino acid transport system substrate-binding protein